MIKLLKFFLKPVKKKFLDTILHLRCNRLNLLNLQSKVSLPLEGNGIVVSLTTYGKRFDSVYLTIESIFRGEVLPSRVILWLDEEKAFNNIPVELERLKARGLEIKITENLGPHKKYYPYVECEDTKVTLVTADDDIIYPKYWLKKLISVHEQNPEVVVCFRAHSMVFNENGMLKPYDDWGKCNTTDASFLNFATGCSGVLYPAFYLDILKKEGRGYLNKCPRADDVWLHAQAVNNNIKIRQVFKRQKMFSMLPDTQDSALVNTNVGNNGNDLQIQRTYSQESIKKLYENFLRR